MTQEKLIKENNLEIIVMPARKEKRFVILYQLTERFYDVEYDKYTWDTILRYSKDWGLFGNKDFLNNCLKEIKQRRIKEEGYKEVKDQPLELHHDSREIHYNIGKLKTPLKQIIHKDGESYLRYNEGLNFEEKTLKIQF